MSFSRHQLSELLVSFRSLQVRGRRECRVKASPMARQQQEKLAAVTTGSARSSGIPCTMGYGLYALSPGTGLFAPVGREPVEFDDLDISTGISGPHDFAVRECIARPRNSRRHAHVHRISSPTLVTIAKRPSHRAGTPKNVNLICPTRQVRTGCDKVTRRASGASQARDPGRHCERSEAIQSCSKFWIASSPPAPRNDGCGCRALFLPPSFRGARSASPESITTTAHLAKAGATACFHDIRL